MKAEKPILGSLRESKKFLSLLEMRLMEVSVEIHKLRQQKTALKHLIAVTNGNIQILTKPKKSAILKEDDERAKHEQN